WYAFFRRERIEAAFFAASQSAESFRLRMPEMAAVWVPSATEPADFPGETPLTARRIDVLELGRRFEAYHERITAPLAAAGRVHLYEQRKGQIVFPTRQKFVRGITDSKISVCYPSSVTHPQRSGNVETVTPRYFESIASR